MALSFEPISTQRRGEREIQIRILVLYTHASIYIIYVHKFVKLKRGKLIFCFASQYMNYNAIICYVLVKNKESLNSNLIIHTGVLIQLLRTLFTNNGLWIKRFTNIITWSTHLITLFSAIFIPTIYFQIMLKFCLPEWIDLFGP